MPPNLSVWMARLSGAGGPAWTPARRLRAGLAAGIVVAAGALGWALGALVGVWIEAALGPDAPPAPARTEDAAQRLQPLSAFDPIFSSNIFHARRSGATQGPVRLTLTGTFRIGATAFALVVGPDGRTEDVYRVGECVPRAAPIQAQPLPGPPTSLPTACSAGQGRLVSVEHERIVVDFGGQRIVIAMEGDRPPDSGAPQAPPSGPGAPVAAVTPFGQTRTGNAIEVHVPAVEVEKTFENFSEIVRQALVVPYTKDGATVGFQIQRIQPGSVFQRIGLQNQDIIRGVNGQPITTADQALRLFTLFRNERQVQLDLDRGTENLRLTYFID